MAGDWIKMRKNLAHDPSVIYIAAAVGLEEDHIVGKLHRLWSWADENTRDGNVDGVTEKWIDRYVGVTGFAKAMRSAGWLLIGKAGISFPKFDNHMSKSAKKRVVTASRVDAHRKVIAHKSGGNCNAADVTEALPEKRREEKIEEVSITQSGRAHEIPTVEQAKGYAASAPVPISEACAVAFHDTQQAAGWITKHGHSIADWRAALRRYASLWNENEKAKPGTKPEHRQTKAATEYPEPKTKLPRL